MFHWHLAHFNIKPVVLIRHPCAVVASQLKNVGYQHIIEKPFFRLPNFRYNKYFAPYMDTLRNIHTAEGLLAAIWAINTKAIYGPHFHKKKWYTLPYEKLYLNPVEEVSKLFRWIDKPIPTIIFKKITTASITTSSTSKEILKKQIPMQHLGKWKKELNQKQISNIMEIVNDIGVDFYSSDELEPDYKKLPLFN